jgi:hypothetical protein
MGVIYDSGWVPAASGTVRAEADTGRCTFIQVVIAASGAQAASAATAYWVAGAETPVPMWKGAKQYATTPRPTGTITVAAPGVNSVNSYIFSNASGTFGWTGWPYSRLGVSVTPSGTSHARIIVDGK